MDDKVITRVSVKMNAKLNLGNFENVGFEVQIDDHVRDIDATTGAAIDRLFKLADVKMAEKLCEYEDRKKNW